MSRKTNITFSDEIDAALTTINQQTGIPVAVLVRKGIVLLLAQYGIAITEPDIHPGGKRGDKSAYAESVTRAAVQPTIQAPVDEDKPVDDTQHSASAAIQPKTSSTALSPSQVIAQRKADAAARLSVAGMPTSRGMGRNGSVHGVAVGD